MTRRLKMLRRLLQVYETIETLREVEALRAAGAVRETESAIQRHADEVRGAAGDERTALLRGDRLGWSFAMERQRVAGLRRKALEPVLAEQEGRSQVARKRYLEMRLWSERMRTLRQGEQDEVAEKEQRRTQQQSDERYLSQRRLQAERDGERTDA